MDEHFDPKQVLRDYFSKLLLGQDCSEDKLGDCESESSQGAHRQSQSKELEVGGKTAVNREQVVDTLDRHPEPVDLNQALLAGYQQKKLQHLLDYPTSDSEPPLPSSLETESASQESLKSLSTSEPEAEDAIYQENEEKLFSLLKWHDNGRPAWAQQHFDTLVFTVGGMNLAVPLITLGHIHKLDDKLVRLAGQQTWVLGLLSSSMGNIKTIDTARFMMPERYDPSMSEAVEFVLSLSGLNWGLAVQEVHQPVQLAPTDVNWRTARSKRPWLAGTVKSKMCALLDVPQLAVSLQGLGKR